jgi:hypothetical protein
MNLQHSATALSPAILFCVLSLAAPGLTLAQGIYKSVDAQGKVTYSQTPPPTATEVEAVTIRDATGGTTTDHPQATSQQVQRLAAEAQQRREEQKARKAAAVADAELRLKQARRGLDAAKVRGDGDWQTIARGGRVESEAYRKRVEQAQREVRNAERALRDAKAGRLPPGSPETPN